VNKIANFKLSNFASSAISNLPLQKKRTSVQLTASAMYCGDRFYLKMPCFIQSSGGTFAVFPA